LRSLIYGPCQAQNAGITTSVDGQASDGIMSACMEHGHGDVALMMSMRLRPDCPSVWKPRADLYEHG
jgi:hypothetical protein